MGSMRSLQRVALVPQARNFGGCTSVAHARGVYRTDAGWIRSKHGVSMARDDAWLV